MGAVVPKCEVHARSVQSYRDVGREKLFAVMLPLPETPNRSDECLTRKRAGRVKAAQRRAQRAKP